MSDVESLARLATVVHVVAFEPGQESLEVVINRGANHGVKPGDGFLVFGEGPRIVDPDTGKDLGQLELVRGQGQVVHVQEHIATIHTTERRRTRPAKRVVRETATIWERAAGMRGNVIEEELSPESEMPFRAVQVGDHAKPI